MMRMSPQSGRGRFVAIAGVCAVALIVLGGYRISGLARGAAPQPGVDQLCDKNLSYIADAMLKYVAKSGGRFPAADKWHDVLCPDYLQNKPVPCPERPNTDCGYAFNSALAGIKSDAVSDPKQTVLFFESDGGWDAAGGSELLPKQPRHRGGDLYVFVNGDVTWRKRGDIADLQWKPAVKTALK